jgi:tryptophan-rich sensory protein
MNKHRAPLRPASHFAVAIAIRFAVAGLGGLVTMPEIPEWYGAHAKPTQPAWIFGPVWSFLYYCPPLANSASKRAEH